MNRTAQVGVGSIFLLMMIACGSTSSSNDPPADGGGITSQPELAQGDASATNADGGPRVTSGDASASCDELTARQTAAFDKHCDGGGECTFIAVSGCCLEYVGIRSDAKDAYLAAKSSHDSVCPSGGPDPRGGCGCADHTESNETVPQTTPPSVIATCDDHKCTAHVGH
jgi:hypothetical protein